MAGDIRLIPERGGWTRSGTTLSPAVAGDTVAVSNNLKLTPTQALWGSSGSYWSISIVGSNSSASLANNAIAMAVNTALYWTSATDSAYSGADTILTRGGAGVLRLGTTSGGTDGTLQVGTLTVGGLVWTVTLGANDSAGAGYRTVSLKVPNS